MALTTDAVTGTYVLNGESALRGTLSLTIANFNLGLSDFVVVHADSLALVSRYDGTAHQTTFGATGVSLASATSRARRLVSDATIALVSRRSARPVPPIPASRCSSRAMRR